MIYSTLTGALGALAAWLLLDVILDLQPGDPYLDAVLNGALIGLAIGVTVNGFAGLLEFKPRAVARGVLIGGLGGLVGGALGLLLAELLYQALGAYAPLRILGWAIFGLFLGMIEGALSGSFRRVLYSGIGGLVGGLIGGLAFYLLGRVSSENFTMLSNTSRAVGFALLGGMTGCFVGLAPVILRNVTGRPAIKVISSGRDEGKERLLDRNRIHIGSDPRCDIPLYGDAAINREHAEILYERGEYVLRPLAGAYVVVHDHKIDGSVNNYCYVLRDGDQFEIGQEILLFRMG
jgi:hypothetical protein